MESNPRNTADMSEEQWHQLADVVESMTNSIAAAYKAAYGGKRVPTGKRSMAPRCIASRRPKKRGC